MAAYGHKESIIQPFGFSPLIKMLYTINNPANNTVYMFKHMGKLYTILLFQYIYCFSGFNVFYFIFK